MPVPIIPHPESENRKMGSSGSSLATEWCETNLGHLRPCFFSECQEEGRGGGEGRKVGPTACCSQTSHIVLRDKKEIGSSPHPTQEHTTNNIQGTVRVLVCPLNLTAFHTLRKRDPAEGIMSMINTVEMKPTNTQKVLMKADKGRYLNIAPGQSSEPNAGGATRHGLIE